MSDQDRILVERARHGDKEAFGELVGRHRAAMLKWAGQVVRNPVKAEDVVQDALLQTIKRIDSLADPVKFLPWLRTIVRNQALMSIRGARHTKELLVATSTSERERDFPHHDGFKELYLTDGLTYTTEFEAMSRESWEDVSRLFDRLGERERAVLKAHSLAGLSVPEVAESLQMKPGAVYTALSRSRTKLVEARFEAEIEQYVAARRRNGRPEERKLHIPYYGFAGAYNTMASTILLALVTMGYRNVTLTDVMGVTGHAFRMQVTSDLGLSGAYAYDWSSIARDGWNGLGFSVRCFGGAMEMLRQPGDLSSVLDEALASLEQGIPVIAWHLSNAEFGLITGYDDSDSSLIVMDTSSSGKKLPYSKLGRLHDASEWFVLIPQKRVPVKKTDMLSDLFARAVRHVRGESTPLSREGKEAYRIWMDALQHRTLTDPLSAAYHAAVTCEARTHAVRFLSHLTMEGGLGSAVPNASLALSHALSLYERTADAWSHIARLFPLPYGADPTMPGPSDRAYRLLERALRAELEAADALEEASYWLRHKPFVRRTSYSV